MNANLGKLALLGSTNLDYLAIGFRDIAGEFKVDLDVFVPAFGQAVQELMAPADVSPLKQFDPDHVLIVERVEDILGDLAVDPLSVKEELLEQEVNKRAKRYLQLIELAVNNLDVEIWILQPLQVSRSPLGSADIKFKNSLTALTNTLDSLLNDCIDKYPGRIRLLDARSWITEFGSLQANPGKYWHLGRVPFGLGFSNHIAKRTIGHILAAGGKTVRLIILDLDNTLWGGVLGEDGLEGIQLGGGYPGSAFKAFQSSLKALFHRGIALAVASKNDETLALHAMKNHPEMILRPESISGHRINWNPKDETVGELLAEFSLTESSCMFIDDNEVERFRVQAAFPEMIVPVPPADSADLSSWLLDLPWLECISLTDSDFKRTSHYQARATINAVKSGHHNIEEFLTELGMELTIERLCPANAERTVQLISKTNQFNTTSRRHTLHRLQEMEHNGAEVYAVGIKDNWSPYEIMGVFILEPDRASKSLSVESFLLSCRYLGRNVETAVMAWILKRARELNLSTIIGEIIDTPKNTPVRDVYKRYGFDSLDDGKFIYQSALDGILMPAYFNLK